MSLLGAKLLRGLLVQIAGVRCAAEEVGLGFAAASRNAALEVGLVVLTAVWEGMKRCATTRMRVAMPCACPAWASQRAS